MSNREDNLPSDHSEFAIRDGAARYTYRFGPFEFNSELEIPELKGVEGTAEIPVSIRVGGLPVAIDRGIARDRWWICSPSESLLTIPDIATFYIGNGHEVRVEPAADALQADISVYLLGSVFGTLCHQNGLLPLHASAVAVDGEVTAFAGDSGAGKSTLAAFLARRGYRIVSDDICLVDTAAGAKLRVIPVAGWLKLWRGSLEQIGETPDERQRVFSEEDKYRLHLGDRERPEVDQTTHLTNIVFLKRPADGGTESSATLEPLPAAATVARLMDMTYLSYLLETGPQQATLFRRCAAMLSQAKVWELTAPKGWDRMASTVDLLERKLLGRESN